MDPSAIGGLLVTWHGIFLSGRIDDTREMGNGLGNVCPHTGCQELNSGHLRMDCIRAATLAMVTSAGLSACAPAETGYDAEDPLEDINRAVHGFNKGFDSVLFRPAATVYGTVVPEPVMRGIENFASNASLPGTIVNDVLQANFADAANNIGRFLVNTTFGLAGLLDPATFMDLPARDSDFGETLHVWGFAEGAYVELPVMGPSTGRDTVGLVADFFMNPVPNVLTREGRRVVTGANWASRVGTRYRFRDTVDSILYGSYDSYEQLRLNYLDSRRYALGDGNTLDVDSSGQLDDLYLFDPYEE